MHYQKTWEGQLTTQVRLEHVIWGEAFWAATMGTGYSVAVMAVMAVFGYAGWLEAQWLWVWLAIPVLFLSAVAFAAVGLLFTAVIPSIDHMNLVFYLLVMPLAFTSSTYFPIENDYWLMQMWLLINPLHHLAEGVRMLLVAGRPTLHLLWAAALFVAMIAVLMPIDLRLLRTRVLGEHR
jgi:lipooligosaccharide transport system permease protein